jgi:hypothetical protein
MSSFGFLPKNASFFPISHDLATDDLDTLACAATRRLLNPEKRYSSDGIQHPAGTDIDRLQLIKLSTLLFVDPTVDLLKILLRSTVIRSMVHTSISLLSLSNHCRDSIPIESLSTATAALIDLVIMSKSSCSSTSLPGIGVIASDRGDVVFSSLTFSA